jgi:hypothetical protein
MMENQQDGTKYYALGLTLKHCELKLQQSFVVAAAVIASF